MTREDTPSKMGFCQTDMEETERQEDGREGCERVDMRNAAEPHSLSLSTRHFENTVDSNERIKIAGRGINEKKVRV